MTTETTVFVLTVLLALGPILVMAGIALTVYRPKALMGPRDNLPASDNRYFERASRANDNLGETLSWAVALAGMGMLLVPLIG